jgi:hypothetical protein
MREILGQLKFNRRRVLISLISSAPLAALSFGRAKAAAKVAQKVAQYQPTPKGGASVRRVQFFHRAKPVQAGRGRDLPVGLVRFMDQEGRLTEERLASPRTGHPGGNQNLTPRQRFGRRRRLWQSPGKLWCLLRG